jgi:UDP-glucose 4-epimerase
VGPQAQIEVTSAGDPDVAGLISRVSGQALAELIDYERRYDLPRGVRAHIEALS